MKESRFPKRRNSLRLKGFDYSSEGAYFVTIATKDGKRYFVQENLRGIVEKQIRSLEDRFTLKVDTFVVMPDHVHLIISFYEKIGVSLSRIVQALKSLVAKDARDSLGIKDKIWQRGFYDHIIRNEKDYLEKMQYVINNPLKERITQEVKLVSTPPLAGRR
jgi:putative transposase